MREQNGVAAGLELLVVIVGERLLHRDVRSSGTPAAQPVAVVPADGWPAARPLGACALVGCSVGPGFDVADLEMLSDASPDRAWIADLAGVPPDLR